MIHANRLDDTIVAVSTGWRAAPGAIVRLSGPRAFELARSLIAGAESTDSRASPGARLPGLRLSRIGLSNGLNVPADLVCYLGPRSYTGQDVAEIHVPGALPLLRIVCDALIERGARRALPGEFTARAYLNGKLDRDQVDDVLRLLRTTGDADARGISRTERRSRTELLSRTADEIAQTLALVEAGIDFVDEEDVRFISPAELIERIDRALVLLSQFDSADAHDDRSVRSHIAIVGLPNAGKSTLFNRLVGYERAIVSPIIGTTRDVICAEIDLDGVPIIVQDCAGLGDSAEELEVAAYVATERAAEQADVVLCVHTTGSAWSARERQALARITADRLMLVLSKSDLFAGDAAESTASDEGRPGDLRQAICVRVSAASGAGINDLKRELLRKLASRREQSVTFDAAHRVTAVAALSRARQLVGSAPDKHQPLPSPDLIALELRIAYEALDPNGPGAVEAVLDRIFGQFCIGK